MFTAIIALVGVVIGGVLTGLVNLLLDSRREFRLSRAAARLALEELGVSRLYLDAALNRKQWIRWTLGEVPFPRIVWSEQRELLARTLNDPTQWQSVSYAYSQLQWVESSLETAETSVLEPFKPFGPGDEAVAKAVLENVEHGRKTLQKLALRMTWLGRVRVAFRKRRLAIQDRWREQRGRARPG